MLNADTVLKSVVETRLGTPVTYLDASLSEANVLIDGLDKVKFPVFINIAPNRNKRNTVELQGSITRKIRVSGFILTQPEEKPTSDYDTVKMKPLVRQCELLADKLIHELNAQTVTDKSKNGIVEFEINEIYAKTDGDLYGVAITFLWPVDEQTKGCYIVE